MNPAEYQKLAHETAVYPAGSLVYLALGLVGETGEVCQVTKKSIRSGQPVDADRMADELGDVLWYVAEICTVFGENYLECFDHRFRSQDDGLPALCLLLSRIVGGSVKVLENETTEHLGALEETLLFGDLKQVVFLVEEIARLVGAEMGGIMEQNIQKLDARKRQGELKRV